MIHLSSSFPNPGTRRPVANPQTRLSEVLGIGDNPDTAARLWSDQS